MLKVSAQLDLVFGKNGFVYNNLGIGSTEIQHIAIDKENKIVTAGQNKWQVDYDNIIINKFFPNGQVDSSFGTNGYVDLSVGYSIVRQTFIAIDNNNKYIIIGNGNSDIFIARLNENGTYDETFGNQGIFRYALPSMGSYTGDNYVQSFHLYPDNSVGIAIYDEFSSVWPPINYQAKGLIKISEQGKLDSTYGENGEVLTFLSESAFFIPNGRSDKGMGYDSDGNSYVVANDKDDSSVVGILEKRKPNGGIDSSFGVNGKIYIDEIVPNAINQIIIDDDGSIYCKSENEILKLTLLGEKDSTWGNQGMIEHDSLFTANSIVITNGEIVIFGTIVGQDYEEFILSSLWFDNKGKPILWNGDALKTYDLGTYEQIPRSIILDNQGDLLIGGYASEYYEVAKDMVLLKIKPSGEFDTSFAENGIGIYKTGGNSTGFRKYISMSDGSLFINGSAYNGKNYNDFIVKHLPGGVVDSSFADNGKIYFPIRGTEIKYNLIGELDNNSILAIFNTPETNYLPVIQKILHDGKIEVNWVGGLGGISLDSTIKYYDYQTLENNKLRIVSVFNKKQLNIEQYNVDGILDSDFGENGKLILNFTDTYELIPSKIIHLNNKILYQGKIPSRESSVIFMILQNGEIDPTFGNNGYVEVPDKSVVYYGVNGDYFVALYNQFPHWTRIIKYNERGERDLFYGNNGEFYTGSYSIAPYAMWFDELFPQSDGSVYMSYSFRDIQPGVCDWAGVLRVDSIGNLDMKFGKEGKEVIPLSPYYLGHFNSFVNKKDGNLMMAGTWGTINTTKYFINKWDRLPKVTSIISQKNDENISLLIFPNPVKNYFSIQINSKKSTELTSIQIHNVSGQLVKEWEMKKEIVFGKNIIQLDLSENIPIGQYILSVKIQNNIYSTKWLKK